MFDNQFKTQAQAFHQNLLTQLPELERLKQKLETWETEDGPYRFYHGSFKVFWLIESSKEILAALAKLFPEGSHLNTFLQEIVDEAFSKKFNENTNSNWTKETRPVVECFFHLKYFLDQAVKYGKDIGRNLEPTQPNDSGWICLMDMFTN